MRTRPARRGNRTSGTVSPLPTRSARWPSCREVLPAISLDGRLSIVPGEPVAPAVDELLDGEQRNKLARKRDRRVKRGERRHRRHAEIAEPGEEIEIAEIDHAERRTENDEAIESLDHQPRSPGHCFGDRREAEVVIAPRRRRRTDEHAVNEKRHRNFLQPQPGVTESGVTTSKKTVVLNPANVTPQRTIR